MLINQTIHICSLFQLWLYKCSTWTGEVPLLDVERWLPRCCSRYMDTARMLRRVRCQTGLQVVYYSGTICYTKPLTIVEQFMSHVHIQAQIYHVNINTYWLLLQCVDPLGCITLSCLFNAVCGEPGGRAWYGITRVTRHATTHQIYTL